jgi:hypothetical protein
LIHHPVMDKNGQVIAAAITSLDLHDIARIAKTYGVSGFHVVTPLEDQQTLIRRITGHWVEGVGARYNPDRQAALELIRIQASLEEALAEIERFEGQRPLTVVTSAKMANSDMSHRALRQTARNGQPIVLMFGTAWGLAPELLTAADYRLEPIYGCGDYNHLAVRSAVAIILDRMLGASPK